jgi:hypothetical protein
VAAVEDLELASKYVGDAQTEVSLCVVVPELVFNESVEVGRIVKTVLIEKSVDHAPGPLLDDLGVPLRQFEPEVLESLHHGPLFAWSVLAVDFGIQSSQRHAGDKLVAGQFLAFQFMKQADDCPSLIRTQVV